MTKEQKHLLIKDICARLPYGVILEIGYGTENGVEYKNEVMGSTLLCDIMTSEYSHVKPYLRPLSSMTEEEKKEILTLLVGKDAIGYFQVENNGITNTDENIQLGPNWTYHWLNFSNKNISLYVYWLNAHHFDYRGLIEKGLALEAPKGMYKTES